MVPREVSKGNKGCNGYLNGNNRFNEYQLRIINVMWPLIMEYVPLDGWGLVRRNNLIIRHRPLNILMRKYK